jgi:hypothetical protein
MKNLSFLLSFALVLLFGACSTPADYYQSVADEVVKVEKETNKLYKLLQDKKLSEAQEAFLKGSEQTQASLKKLENMPVFRGDDAFRETAIKFVAFHNNLFKNEYQKAFDQLKKSGVSCMAHDEDIISLETIMNIYGEEVEMKQNFLREQYAFVKKYGLIAATER